MIVLNLFQGIPWNGRRWNPYYIVESIQPEIELVNSEPQSSLSILPSVDTHSDPGGEMGGRSPPSVV
jgi:hypothetical protein